MWNPNAGSKAGVPTNTVSEEAPYEQIPDTHHDHLINLRTGDVIEFQSEEIERLQADIARRLGYRLIDHRLELYAVPLDDKAKR